MFVSNIIITCRFQKRVDVLLCCSKVTFIHVITSWNIEDNVLIFLKSVVKWNKGIYMQVFVSFSYLDVDYKVWRKHWRRNFPIQFYLSNLKSRLSWLNGRLLFCVRLNRECHNLSWTWMCPKLSIYHIILISLYLFYN